MRSAVLFALVLAACAVGRAAAAADGDPVRGAGIYQRCQACHSLDRNRSGPKHCGLFGRKAGSVAGYRYSKAMREAGFTWDAASLDRFLANPMVALPGTRMGYAGVRDPGERADLIAYLKTATAGSADCP